MGLPYTAKLHTISKCFIEMTIHTIFTHSLDQSWVFFGRTDVEAETPILQPPNVKSWLIWKDSDGEKDWGQVEKGKTEDEMVGWYHLLNGCEFAWTLRVRDGQGALPCCGSWGHRVGHYWVIELNWTGGKKKKKLADLGFIVKLPEFKRSQIYRCSNFTLYWW